MAALAGVTPLWAQGEAPAPQEQEPAAPSQEEAIEPVPPAVLPVFVALHPDLHAFRAFADGGWDGNWYIGFNTCWIVQLPKPPPGEYARAFVGARLGRAKTKPRPGGRPWDKDPLPGKVYVAISSVPAFSPAQSFFLADTKDIPVEPDYENPNLAVGHGEWFWAEIPLKLIRFDGPNYLAAWSNTAGLLSASSAPILAAAIDPQPGQQAPRAWLNNAIAGVPPREPTSSIGTPISFYLPALVLKLVPPNEAQVEIAAFSVTSASPEAFLARFGVLAQDLETAWIEASADGQGWERISPLLRHPPFVFSLPLKSFDRSYQLAETLFLRAAAEDALGNLGRSEPVQLPFTNPDR